MGWMKDETGLDKRDANYRALTPLSHLRRAAKVFPKKTALVYGDFRASYAQYHDRCTRLASGLAQLGVTSGDVVATLLPNIPAAGRSAFRHSRMWRGLEHHQHTSRQGHHRLYF